MGWSGKASMRRWQLSRDLNGVREWDVWQSWRTVFQTEGIAREKALKQRTAHEPVLNEYDKAEGSKWYSEAAVVEKLLPPWGVGVFGESMMRNQGRLPGGTGIWVGPRWRNYLDPWQRTLSIKAQKEKSKGRAWGTKNRLVWMDSTSDRGQWLTIRKER